MNFTGEIVRLKNYKTGFTPKTRKPFYRFKISSPKLYDDLIIQGCFEHKSTTLKFPTPNQVPTNFLNSFICGYMDGNGSVYKTKGSNGKLYYRLSFCGTEEMMNGISKFFNSDVKPYYRWPDRNNNNAQIAWSGTNTVYDKLKILYIDTPIKLQRKYEIFLELSKDSRIIQ